jgi:hypothetical protein
VIALKLQTARAMSVVACQYVIPSYHFHLLVTAIHVLSLPLDAALVAGSGGGGGIVACGELHWWQW